jgi:aminopeptidase
MTDPRCKKLAQVLVDYSLNLQAGEIVALRAMPAAAPLVSAVYEYALERGALPVLLMNLPGIDEIHLRLANDSQMAFISPFTQLAYEKFDALVSLGGEENRRSLSRIDPARQAARQRALRPLTETFMRRDSILEHSGDGEKLLKWVVAEFPTNAGAQDADMSLRDWENFIYSACHVNGDDDPVAYWQGVKTEQERLVNWLKGKNQVRVQGTNIDLSLSIAGRTFVNACGSKNMPDGEIFTGPVEESVNGWVKFTYPAVFQGRKVDGVEIGFEGGKAVHISAETNQDFLRQVLTMDSGASYLGEFAFGTNFGIQEFTKQILFDEKMGGTLHMAFGIGYPETGSKNTSGLHWDMICDMRQSAEVWVDGELFYRNGAFTV